MNNPSDKQRVIRLAVTRRRVTKKKKPLDEISRRRQQDLSTHWHLLCSLGMPLKAVRMARRLKVHASAPSQYLNGSIALNIEWMMEFSIEMCCAPQDIFRDWPYGQVTPSGMHPGLVKLLRSWKGLSHPTRQHIQDVIDRDLGR